MAQQQFKHLTPEQVDFFLENGFVVIRNSFTEEKAAEWTEKIWICLGLDHNDKTTWDKKRIHMPWHRREDVASFAPKVWEIMKELLGGAERIDQPSVSRGDSFVMNLGTEALEKTDAVDPKDLDNWHVDGDFFVHYLDSPEQALPVVPFFSDIQPHPKDDPGYYSILQEVKKCTKFFEITGEVGDVILLHPLTLHSASQNHLRIPRFITNPPVSLKKLFDSSLVEKKTPKALGVHRLGYKVTTERERIAPKSRAAKDKLKREEERRLAELAAKKQFTTILVA